jgi:membrane protease YdiL (CAAX protease family)
VGFGVTLAVGLAGAAGAARTKERTAAMSTALVAMLGIAAFGTIRLASPIPPMRATPTVLLMLVGAAVAEELFFRRFLYGALSARGPAIAIGATAVAFALVHVPAYGSPVLPIDLAAGLVLGWQRWATGSWRASALSHVAANIMAVL